MTASPRKEVRPEATPSVLVPTILVAIVLGTIALIVTLATGPLHPGAMVAIFATLGLTALTFVNARAKWSKTKLVFAGDRLIFETGGLFSSSQTELLLTNVTYCEWRLPVFESLLYGTGALKVESAGSGGSEVGLEHVANPEALFDEVVEALQTAGFALAKKELITDAQPAMFGVMLGLAGQFVGLLPLAVGMLAGAAGLMSSGNLLAGLALACVTALLVLAIPGFVFKDAKGTRYRCYRDCVTMVGAFPRRVTLIPMENVSDTRVDQSLIDRVLGLWTVSISCQGAGKEITLTNLEGGKAFAASVDGERLRVRDEHKAARAAAKAARVEAGEATSKPETARRRERDLSSDFTGSFRRSLVKPLMTTLPIVLVLVGLTALAAMYTDFSKKDGGDGVIWLGIFAFIQIGSLVRAVIDHFTTEYRIEANVAKMEHKFLSTKEREFAFEKVTAMTFHRDPLDRLLGTGSIHVYSIGSAQTLSFPAIPWSEDLPARFLSKIGMKPDRPSLELQPTFKLLDWCKAHPTAGPFLLGVLLGAGALVANGQGMGAMVLLAVFLGMVGLGVGYAKLYHGACRLSFHGPGLCCHRGLIMKERVWVPWENVKDTTATDYPLSTLGDLTVNIAGEVMAFGGAGATAAGNATAGQGAAAAQGQQVAVSNGFTLNYLPNPVATALFLETVIDEAPPEGELERIWERARVLGPKPSLHEGRPSYVQKLFPFGILALLFLAPLAPAVAGGAPLWAAGLVVLFVAACILLPAHLTTQALVYRLEERTVSRYSGVFFKRRKAVLYSQTDFIKVDQGAMGKVFGTGTVLVHTTGSSRAELTLDALPKYAAFGDELKKRYEA